MVETQSLLSSNPGYPSLMLTTLHNNSNISSCRNKINCCNCSDVLTNTGYINTIGVNSLNSSFWLTSVIYPVLYANLIMVQQSYLLYNNMQHRIIGVPLFLDSVIV